MAALGLLPMDEEAPWCFFKDVGPNRASSRGKSTRPCRAPSTTSPRYSLEGDISCEHMCVYVCVCLCVCVCVRERVCVCERERESCMQILIHI